MFALLRAFYRCGEVRRTDYQNYYQNYLHKLLPVLPHIGAITDRRLPAVADYRGLVKLGVLLELFGLRRIKQVLYLGVVLRIFVYN